MYKNVSDLSGQTVEDLLNLDELRGDEGYLDVYTRKHIGIRVQETPLRIVLFLHVDADWIEEKTGKRLTHSEVKDAALEGSTFSGLDVFETMIDDNDDSFAFEVYIDPTPFLNEKVETFFLLGKTNHAIDALNVALISLPTGSDYFNA